MSCVLVPTAVAVQHFYMGILPIQFSSFFRKETVKAAQSMRMSKADRASTRVLCEI